MRCPTTSGICANDKGLPGSQSCVVAFQDVLVPLAESGQAPALGSQDGRGGRHAQDGDIRLAGDSEEMTPSDACYDLIKRFEGCKLTAYPDPATGGDPWTIGVGHTGPEVKSGMTIARSTADAYLVKDAEHAADAVRRLVTVPLKQQQFDALVSLVFNIGSGAFGKSTLLRKLNSGDTLGASLEILRWDKAANKVMPGLTKRRAAEQSLFLS